MMMTTGFRSCFNIGGGDLSLLDRVWNEVLESHVDVWRKWKERIRRTSEGEGTQLRECIFR